MCTQDMKEHVRENFDTSPAAYGRYESRTGRFADLAERLEAAMGERQDGTLERLLDAGAGSGASTRVFDREGRETVALDISGEMLRENGAINRIQADFDRLPFADRSFDGVAFTASLFLTPDPDTAAEEAHRVVRPGGTVGAVAPLGWTTADGADVFEQVGRESRSPTTADEVEAALREPFDVVTGTWTFETTASNLRLFHAVPAMAARLYPRLDHEERVDRATELLEDVDGPLRQRWRWIVGTRGKRTA